VDERSYGDFVRQTEALLEGYTGWKPDPDDPAGALVRVFARMAQRVADRLNRVPDRAFLAFLDMVGVEPLPPQAARVPLTFSLAAGAGADAVVPARTPVAGQPLEGETEPVVFETERELVVTRTTLEAVVVHEPANDHWADRTADAAAGTAFEAFTGGTPAMHRLHLSHRRVFGMESPKTVLLRFGEANAADIRWHERVAWSWRAPGAEHPLPPPVVPAGDPLQVSLADVPAVPPSEVGGVQGAWVTAELAKELRRRGVAPETVLGGGASPAPGDPVFPFGSEQSPGTFALSFPPELIVPGSTARVEVEIDPRFPAPRAGGDLRLEWEHSVKAGWKTLAVTDTTGAFTRDGEIAFPVPPDWEANTLPGRAGTWLRARVVAGGYGPHLPVARRLAVGYDLPVGSVASLEARVVLGRTGLVPPAGAAGTVPLELTNDFLPFGGQPATGAAFYLALPQLADKQGAKAKLWFTLNPFTRAAPVRYLPPVLAWEFYDAATARWTLFGESGVVSLTPPDYDFHDGTASFTRVGRSAVTFDAPALGQVEVNGRRDAWIRVLLRSGDYGTDASYTSTTDPRGIISYSLVPAAFRPPSVRALELDYVYTSPWTAPDAAALETDDGLKPLPRKGDALAPFTPFSIGASVRPSLLLGFRRPGEAVGFANRAVTLYLGVAETPFGGPGTRAGEPASLAWWYWSGRGWSRLGVSDETAVLTRRGLVTFVGPADFAASTRFGREAFWLRVTPERGGWPSPPRLERVLLNTVWAEHAAQVTGEVLGSGTGRPGQRVRTLRAPVLPGERIEVREADRPSRAEIDALEREGGPDPLGPADAAGTWVRWTAVPDFHGSGPASRHYVVDRVTGEVGFGDGVHGRVPPPGRANLRAAVYRTGGGPAGNRPAGNLTQLKTPIAYVERVANAEPSGGGAAAESLDALRVRGPGTLRHRERAVTVADLEDLAMQASPEVAVARAIPPGDGGEAGRVRVVVVPRSAAAKPVPSLELLDRVEAYLAERLPAAVELEVLGPEWVSIDVTAEVVPVSPAAAGEVQRALSDRLAAFLHPLTGGPRDEGWPFGRRPYRSDLYAVVEGTPGVDHATRLELRESVVPLTPSFLVHSGAHTVWVTGSTDD
jgi:hypothetical protein